MPYVAAIATRLRVEPSVEPAPAVETPPAWHLKKHVISLDQQLANVRRWNAERGWGFTDDDFDAVDTTPCRHSGFVVDVIAVYLPDKGGVGGVQRTFDELWEVAAQQYFTAAYRSSFIESGPEQLQLLGGIEHVPGIRRVTIDLGAHWQQWHGVELSPDEVRDSTSAHAEVLAAAAHFPKWLQAMNGTSIPFVWLPGYMERGTLTPYLERDKRTWSLSLFVGRTIAVKNNRACPVIVQ